MGGKDEPWGVVTDGYSDIAMRACSDKMRTNATGRQRFQKVYLLASTASKATASATKFDPKSDCMTGSPKIPNGQELVPTDGTREYLEVGLVIGEEPDRYMATGKARDKEREKARERRGVLDRHPSAMRVFTPTTEFVQKASKFYVGCNPIDGRLSTRLVHAETIFFYPEFWESINEIKTVRERQTAVTKACREHAAAKSAKETPATTFIAADNADGCLVSHPSVTTAPKHVASLLALHHAMYTELGDTNIISAMREVIVSAVGCSGYGPDTSTEGIFALLDFSEPLSGASAAMTKRELEDHAGLRVDAAYLIDLHRAVVQLDPEVREPLQSRTLQFFIRYHMAMEASEVNETSVKRALHATFLHAESCPPNSTPSKNPLDGKKGRMQVGDFCHILGCIENVLVQMNDSSAQASAAVAKQFGGVLHRSLEDLMDKIAVAVDTATLQGLVAQVAAVQAGVHADIPQKSRQILCDLIEYIRHVRSVASADNEDETAE